MELTSDQIAKLKSLGIEINNSNSNTNFSSPFVKGESVPQRRDEGDFNPGLRNSTLDIKHSKSNFFPLLSISGLTILSFSGLILFKNKSEPTTLNSTTNYPLPETSVTPTQVPKSIQHYLLTSQQFFTQASQNQSVDDLNQSIIAGHRRYQRIPLRLSRFLSTWPSLSKCPSFPTSTFIPSYYRSCPSSKTFPRQRRNYPKPCFCLRPRW